MQLRFFSRKKSQNVELVGILPLKRQVEVVLSVDKGNLTEMVLWDHFLEHDAISKRLYLHEYLVDSNF